MTSRAPAPRLVRCALAFLLAPALGCYGHIPATLEEVAPGDYVRAVVVANRTGTSPEAGREVRTIRGTVAERAAGRVVISVAPSRAVAPRGLEPLDQRISVVDGDVLRVDRRRLNGVRTGGFVALVVGAAIIATVTGSRIVGGGSDQPSATLDDSIRGWLGLHCCR